MSKLKRVISLVVVAVFALLAFVLLVSKSVEGQKKTQPTKKPVPNDRKALARKPAASGGLKARMGEDDGFSAVVFFSADVHGNLEVCGCPIRPLGGVARGHGLHQCISEAKPWSSDHARWMRAISFPTIAAPTPQVCVAMLQ